MIGLPKEMSTPCVVMIRESVSDGEGGLLTSWRDGAQIEAAITMDRPLEARIAESAGLTNVYRITTNDSVQLVYHDVIKRLEDGAIFRVTSDGKDQTSPRKSKIKLAVVTAERWEIRDD